MIADARARLATVLSELQIPVHMYPAGSLTPPAAVIDWGSPLLESTTSKRTVIGLEVRITTSAAASSSSVARLEELISASVPLLQAASIRLQPIPAPTSQDDGRTHTAVIPVYVTVERP